MEPVETGAEKKSQENLNKSGLSVICLRVAGAQVKVTTEESIRVL